MLICVGIPCLDGRPYANTVDSLLAEQMLGARQGIHFLILWEIGCSLIGVARNRIARSFLDVKEADCLVFLDADISWTAGDMAKLAERPEDVVGATYRAKRDDTLFHVRGSPEKHDDLYKVEGVPTGFLKVSRQAFEKIEANPYKDENGRDMRDYFPTGYHNGEIWGEDYGFCRLWRESGGSVWLDPTIKLRHHDGNRFYTGDVEQWLEEVHAI